MALKSKFFNGNNIIYTFTIIMIFCLIVLGCGKNHNQVKVGEVPFNQCVPNDLIFDYVEQMKYLALSDKSGTEKQKAIIEIESKMIEIRNLLEEYRRNYGYGNCNE